MPVRVAVDWIPLEREVLAHAGPTAFYKVASPSGQQHEAMVWLPKALMNQRVRYPPPYGLPPPSAENPALTTHDTRHAHNTGTMSSRTWS